MDHHCPWVGGCVAFRNHKYFVLFLFYACFGCLYSTLTMGLMTLKIMNDHKREYTTVTDPKTGSSISLLAKDETDKQQMILASALSSVLVLAIAILLFTHVYFTFSS